MFGLATFHIIIYNCKIKVLPGWSYDDKFFFVGEGKQCRVLKIAGTQTQHSAELKAFSCTALTQ